MNEVVYTYDGSFDGFLSCVFARYANKEVPIAICRDEDFPPTLFPCRFIPTDPAHARRVLRKVLTLSPYGARLLQRGFLTCLPDRELALLNLGTTLLEEGPGFLRDRSHPAVYPVFRAVRHLEGEVHVLKGFVRFSDLGGVLGGEIEPKNRVLPLLRSHFCARYPQEAFFLYDRTHHEALLHAAGQAVIRPLADFQMAPPDEAEARYRTLWKRFYDTIAIPERNNPRCQNTHLPKRYQGMMTEFQAPSYFQAARVTQPHLPESSPADGPVPFSPDGRSEPGTRPLPGPSAPGSAP